MNCAISRILVPVDFSADADFALSYARALASRLGALLEIMHVVAEPVASDVWASGLTDVSRAVEGAVESAEQKLRRHYAVAGEGEQTRAIVREGQVAATIAMHAEAARADLIVMGAGEHRGLTPGGVAASVVRRTPCPVLVVRDAAVAPTMKASAVFTTFGSVLGRHGTSRE